jgi:thiamine kinase-like enzyme
LVERVVARPAGTPDHWSACHGDLTPWNLRIGDRSGTPWLLDWETAGWAPPGFDEVYFLASTSAISRRPRAPRPPTDASYAEAARAAAAAIRARPDDDPPLTTRMLATLDVLGA